MSGPSGKLVSVQNVGDFKENAVADDGQKVAVVTGGSSGIGAASARALAADGWKVIVAARRLERLEALAQEIGGTAVALDVLTRNQLMHLQPPLGKSICW